MLPFSNVGTMNLELFKVEKGKAGSRMSYIVFSSGFTRSESIVVDLEMDAFIG